MILADSHGRRIQGEDSFYSIKWMLPVQEDAFWTYECCSNIQQGDEEDVRWSSEH